jgi:hypothetical protein
MVRWFNARGEAVDRLPPPIEAAKIAEGATTMRVRAIATFQGRYGFVRTGEIFLAEDAYAHDLIAKKKVKLEPERQQPEPDRKQAHPEAPRKKTEPTEPPASESHASAAPKADGPAKPSVLSRAGRAVRRVTRPGRAAAPKP